MQIKLTPERGLGISGLGAGGFLDNKRHALALALVVEGQQANVSIWIRLITLLDLPKNLRRICAAEHWQLPKCPIPAVVVTW